MTMRIAKLTDRAAAGRWVVLRTEGAEGTEVLDLPTDTDLATLLRCSESERRAILDAATGPGEVRSDAELAAVLAAPVDADTEVWAAGVTYQTSRAARMAESADSDVYARVYDADRPELFFKSVGWRVSGPGAAIGIRADSSWDVPEPELAVVMDSAGGIAGYTVCNDVSSRSIEGANPLYLPQAKLFHRSCAVGPWIVPAWEVTDPYALEIRIEINRAGRSLWSGATSTAKLHRRLEELVSWLHRSDDFPHGAVLSTGTCVVPDDTITLQADDTVTIEIDGIGDLTNEVRQAPGGFGDQMPRRIRPAEPVEVGS